MKDSGVIPASIQSKVVYRRSSQLFDNIIDITPNGLAVKDILRKLGALFRKKQIESALNSPTPNSFVLSEKITDIIPSIKNKHAILDILSYGFLEETPKSSKKVGSTKVYAYFLNRMLCPYFGISINHFKNPLPITDDLRFLNCFSNVDCTIQDLSKFIKFQGIDEMDHKDIMQYFEE
ncbi:MAG: hypothetical protein EU530_04610 [Promethearchaeota archaeon]|nr:MAG: hypothetical protein EU530_04610 [Candidatus Lokiarchaeota archaeon]